MLALLDQDYQKTHRSHTKKINHVCAQLEICPDVNADLLFTVRPPDSADENLQVPIQSHNFLRDSASTRNIGLTVFIRCKEKQTARTTINCYTVEKVHECLRKGCKIVDVGVDNDKHIAYEVMYSRYVTDIIGKFVWNFYKAKLADLKAALKARSDEAKTFPKGDKHIIPKDVRSMLGKILETTFPKKEK